MNLLKYWKNSRTDNNSTNKLTIVLSAIYLIALFWILVFKTGVRFSYMATRKVNLIPFSEPLILHGKIDFGEIIMNVMIFVPPGIYAGVLFKNRGFIKNISFFFLISFIIEGLQFILRVGAFDITDIITNTSGGIIGLMIFTAIERLFRNSVKAQKFINIIAAIGTALLILFFLLLKTNNLWIKYQ